MLDILRQRRSVRQYTSEPLSPEIIDQLKEAVLRSPSSRGLDPWEFIFVTDKALLAGLATAKPHGAHFLRDAALGVVVLGDEAKADTWIEDCSIATIILHLAAQSLGLGSCWVQIRLREHLPGITAEERVRQILNIPDHLRVEAIVSIGHPAKAPKPHPRQSLKDQRIKTNTHA
ncbi:MAG: NAD(P)H-dependent dehydrogenase/reductase [Deltaproteobacteria bacterium]|nr:NAD(P)H-dependent dehydrogenase/reductase [Deltaproteobacteria bacterium]